MRIEQLEASERPQERLIRNGAGSLSDQEILALILRQGTPQHPVLEVSAELLRQAGSLSGLLRFQQSDFLRQPGVGVVKAVQLQAVIELSRRILQRGKASRPLLDSPENVREFMLPRVEGLRVEKFWVLSLDRKNRFLQLEEISSGTATASLVHAREVFRPVLLASATALICVHNHPSGDPDPSRADIQVTRQLRSAAHVLQVDLLDHVIIGRTEDDPHGQGFYSFADAGLL